MSTSLFPICALTPIVSVGGSSILGWLLTLAIIAALVYFVIWLVSKFAGPPNIPDPFRWIIWVVVSIALLIFIFAALGIHLP